MSSNCSGGTIRCRKPFLVQIEQLHSVTRSRSVVTRKRTRPQWHPPSWIFAIGSLSRYGVYEYPATQRPAVLPERPPCVSSAINPDPAETIRTARDRARARRGPDGGRRGR